ncbi:coiled-coil domain-containing protein 57-like [Elysia marginata]|uniref:Coiled-coil domain-containing protein 57-like n=1 Tax=Elysia marginata TaxID=1093978 RepID=A0AAV4H2B8_9GAST|nr:coiled-coil domain-containing protein 57-like [Elysia marginata]
MDEVDTKSWKKLAEQKEKEWREVLESRIESLESTLVQKDKVLFDEKSKFHELKEHFKYNLKLLEERDRELEKYDISFQEVRASLNSKNAELSELKIHIDDLKNVINREEKAKDELQSNYQRRLREKQAEVDDYKSSKDNEVQCERTEYEQFRRNLHKQLASVHGELETQKRELTTEFESAMKKREHEFKLQKDELEAKVFEHDLKVKLLEKELELTRSSNQQTLNHAEEVESSQRELEKSIKQKEWELADMKAVKDSQIAELESKLLASESANKKMHEDFQRKYKRELKAAAEREEELDRAKVQTELDWQRRCEILETKQYNMSEELIEKLTSARNDAQALVRERERELHHKVLLIKSLHREKDQLKALLRENNIPLDRFVKYSIDMDDAEEEMNYLESLQKQNSDLKNLIAQMRSEMESLAPVPSKDIESKSGDKSRNFV